MGSTPSRPLPATGPAPAAAPAPSRTCSDCPSVWSRLEVRQDTILPQLPADEHVTDLYNVSIAGGVFHIHIAPGDAQSLRVAHSLGSRLPAAALAARELDEGPSLQPPTHGAGEAHEEIQFLGSATRAARAACADLQAAQRAAASAESQQQEEEAEAEEEEDDDDDDDDDEGGMDGSAEDSDEDMEMSDV